MSDALINGLDGAGGGIIAQLITYPLQTVNTLQQTERDPKKEKMKIGTIEQMCQVVKQEGWERLYGGLVPSLVGTAASQGSFNSTGIAITSKLPRFSDTYTLIIASADPQSISAKPSVEFTKSITKWFTKDGVLVEGLFSKDVEGLIC